MYTDLALSIMVLYFVAFAVNVPVSLSEGVLFHLRKII